MFARTHQALLVASTFQLFPVSTLFRVVRVSVIFIRILSVIITNASNQYRDAIVVSFKQSFINLSEHRATQPGSPSFLLYIRSRHALLPWKMRFNETGTLNRARARVGVNYQHLGHRVFYELITEKTRDPVIAGNESNLEKQPPYVRVY